MCELQVVKLANLHPRMERNILVSWLKHEGDPVRKGEPLYLVETRKDVFEVCSEFGGSVKRWLVPEGSSVAVGQELVLLRTTAGERDSAGVTAQKSTSVRQQASGWSEERSVHIKILGPGCANCDLAERRVWKALSETRVAAIVAQVTEDDGWQRYLPMATPGLVVNETLVCAGRIPDTQEISRWIASAPDRNGQDTAHPAGQG